MRVEVYLTLLIVSAGSALLFGTRGERWLGATVLGGNLLTMAVEGLVGASFTSVSASYVLLDAALAAALVAIAVKHPSWVTICISAFQLNGTLGHFVKVLAAETIPFSYAFLLKVWAWPMVLTLLAARAFAPMRQVLLARQWPPFVKRAD
jgi:hypothetical protein